MTKEQFRQLAQSRFLFLDGATGSNLQKRGMPSGVCPERWITEHKEVLIGLQQEYIRAGSNIIYAPTFSANRIKLQEYQLEDQIEALNAQLVAISKEAARGQAYVAGNLTMTGQILKPAGSMDFEELIQIYKEQISCLEKAGADLLIVETMMSLQESRAALLAAKEAAPRLPVMVTMTFEADGRSLFGTDAATAAIVLESLGADAIGANCSTGPAQMAAVIRHMAEVTNIPIIAKPNAGLPHLQENGETAYDMQAAEFGEKTALLIKAGATILGGCCGTTPAHIASMTKMAAGLPLPDRSLRKKPGIRYLASERKSFSFGLDDPFFIVGERINPTGKKRLQEELRNGSLEMVAAFAEEQEEKGAAILDVNLGMNGIDEKAMMLAALEEIGAVTKLPLSIDSSNPEVMEAALRRYPGRALINSVSLESEKCDRMLALAKKYGAMFILLPLSDAGLPKDLTEKIEIIEQIEARAYQLGLRPEDIIVDGLVTTVGANPLAAKETLETIRYCRQKGLATTCGLSNISFGLPERSCVNTAFLTMAIQAGLTMAIANPSQELLVSAAFASDLLLAKPESDLRYISYTTARRERCEKTAAAYTECKSSAKAQSDIQPVRPAPADRSADQAVEVKPAEQAAEVYEAVLKGNRRGIEQLTKQALDAGLSAKLLLDESLLPAIDAVGELFDRGRYFLPQLIASAEAMKLAVGILEPLLLESGNTEEKPVAVLATVEGDIHDIGKNLVALMLKNHGFEVIDLGKDVPKETIVETAAAYKAKVIGLSALMTTTMREMKQVVEYARAKNTEAKIIIGGAVVTEEYAKEIGADGYAKDAADAARLACKLL